MRHNTKVILIALCVMLVSIGGSGALNVAIAASQGRHDLTYTDKAEDGAPIEVTLGVAMGAFRGIFVNVLWLRANNAKEEGRFYESIELARSITKLQPRLPRALQDVVGPVALGEDSRRHPLGRPGREPPLRRRQPRLRPLLQQRRVVGHAEGRREQQTRLPGALYHTRGT